MSSAIRETDRRAPAGGWRRATVREITHPTPRGVMLRLEVDDRVDHMAGQHYVVRLRAPDGYTAQRSYSVASPPSDPLCEFFVEELNNGEVSTYLAEGLMVGDVLEVRGPIGGWFVWDGASRGVGIAGGRAWSPWSRCSDTPGRWGAATFSSSSCPHARWPSSRMPTSSSRRGRSSR